MPGTEYKVLPAPSKGRRGSGIKGGEARFAHALETLINEMAATGWQYLRSDMLPHEERQGIRSTQTTYRSVLVFRRDVAAKHMPDSVANKAPSALPPEPVLSRVQAVKSTPARDFDQVGSFEGDDPETPEHESEAPPERFT